MSAFSIAVIKWLADSEGPDEIQQTSAEIRIEVGGHIATRIDDMWSRSVQTEIRVNAYPLALWIAASWWRLRAEPRRSRAAQDLPWRMSHELPAAGGGFLWPPITFEADGDAIILHCRRSLPPKAESAQFLSEFHEKVALRAFENEMEEFVRLVLARLEALGLADTPLRELWDEVCKERRSPSLVRLRELEAKLGYDPEEAPPDLMDRIQTLAQTAGHDAINEIAPVCAGDSPQSVLSSIEELSGSAGIDAYLGEPRESAGRSLLPWEKGKALAHEIRHRWGLRGAVPIGALAKSLGVRSELLEGHSGSRARPIGLGVRNGEPGHVKLLFRGRRPTAVRFEAARLLAAHLTTPVTESWLPVTDAVTSRQKLQRAFAAEFLCPIEPLQEVLDGDFSEVSMEMAADHFGVSEHTVEYQLRNHGIVPWDLSVER